MATRERSRKTISEHISDDIPSQMKILNMVIPILMHFFSFVSNLSVTIKPHRAASHPEICDVINDVKLSPTGSQDILSQIFDVIQSDFTLQNQVH